MLAVVVLDQLTTSSLKTILPLAAAVLDGLLDDAAGRAADVERPQRQLRARLADGLRRDDADRLADVDQLVPRTGCGRSRGRRRRARHSQVSTERISTRLDAGLLDAVGQVSVDDRAGLGDQLARRSSMTSSAATRPTMRSAQRLDDLLALLQAPRSRRRASCRSRAR